MKFTDEQLQEFYNLLENKAPLGALRILLEKAPDDVTPQMILPFVSDAARGIPKDLPDEQIAQKIYAKVKKAAAPPDNKAADAMLAVRNYFDVLHVEMRLIDNTVPDTEVDYFGYRFSSPIMTAALSHLGSFHPDWDSPMEKYALAARKANILHWVGMAENAEFEKIMAAGAKTVRIVKPYEDEKKIYSQLEQAERLGAVAAGMDIDHIFTKTGDIDVVMGEKMAPKSIKQIKDYVNATGLPFIVKGILSTRDAEKCVEAGASGIVVSHHGGRLPYAVPPVRILPEIRKKTGDHLKIFVDCGIKSGYDAYKAMALGADGVGIGTQLIPVIQKGTAEDVASEIEEMTMEMRGMMAYTGVKDCRSFDPDVIISGL